MYFFLLRSKHIEHDLFSVNKLSVAGGPDYIITCSQNGDTFIVDQKSQVASFKLGKSVVAFCSGVYTVKSNTKPASCFVFVTTLHEVCIFY